MRKFLGLLLLVTALLTFSCSEEQAPVTPAPQDDGALETAAQALAWSLVSEAGWPVAEDDESVQMLAQCHNPHVPISGFDRTPIAGDIVHYSIRIQTGPGEYDQIGIHRVVRESRPYRPIRTRKGG
jgi:hypothetical protein